MATHSSVLARRIPGTGKPGGLPSMGSHRVGHDWSDLAAAAAEHLCHPKCICLVLISTVMISGDGALGRRLCHGEEVLMNGISTVIKKRPQSGNRSFLCRPREGLDWRHCVLSEEYLRFPIKCISLKKKKKKRETSASLLPLLPHNTLQSQTSVNQEAGPHQKPNLRVPWSWTS